MATKVEPNDLGNRASTSARRLEAKTRTGRVLKGLSRGKVLVAVFSAAVLIGVTVGASGSAAAITIPGIIGFITSDGLFFVQVGYATIVGYVFYIGNGSDVYAAALVVNVTSVTASTQVAHIAVYEYASKSIVANENVIVPGYSSLAVSVSLPQNHSYMEYRLGVDQTPWWFYAFTPYSFLGFTGLQDGGVDFATFIAVGLFFAYAIPFMVKGERMTKRAIYSPKWNATLWLHGIFFGLVGSYVAYFSWWNVTFGGWEFVIIPIPEAIFLFFWTASRHSKNQRALFIQVVPRMGQRLAVIMRAYFIGNDPDGDLVIMRSGSPIQWWFRSRGHHVKVFRRSEAGALEPFPLNVLKATVLTKEQVRDPVRFPRGAKYDAHDDFPVVNTGDGDDSPFERIYFVPRISKFRVTWPGMVMHRDVPVPAHTNLVTGAIVPAGTESRWCWPYIKDGHAEIELCSWHYMDVLAQAMGYMTAEDLAAECDNLAIQLWTERGFRHTETSRKADERIMAEEDLRNRPDSDILEGELEQYVVPLPAGRRGRKQLAEGREGDA